LGIVTHGNQLAGLVARLRRGLRLASALLLLGTLVGGCAAPGILTDGTSVSGGTFNNGYLRKGRRLPPQGIGYVIPQLWQDRGANFGTDEMVLAIMRAAKRVAKEYPGATLGVADLSLPGGGESTLHRSHENGHDADLIWYALDENNRPVAPVDSMPAYGRDLWAKPPHETPNVVFGPYTPRRFDIRRNWALVRALLSDPDIEVQYMFVHTRLRALLLAEGRRQHDDEELLDRAEALLKQPGDSLPHDDHLHLRIYCSPSDRALGCQDYGPLRYWRKRYKYMPPAPRPDIGSRKLAKLFSTGVPATIVLGPQSPTLTATSSQ
jgi:penicillin-insensitive murein endopeptidase